MLRVNLNENVLGMDLNDQRVFSALLNRKLFSCISFSVVYKLTSDVVLLWYLNSWISLLTWWPNLSSRTLNDKDM